MDLATIDHSTRPHLGMGLPDRRRSHRERTCLPAKLIGQDRRRKIDCTVVDISATGARLSVCPSSWIASNGKNTLPDIIHLFLDSERTYIACKRKWNTVNELGVQFCTPFQYG